MSKPIPRILVDAAQLQTLLRAAHQPTPHALIELYNVRQYPGTPFHSLLQEHDAYVDLLECQKPDFVQLS